jgi:sirohydrochlorin cobaltochelatase
MEFAEPSISTAFDRCVEHGVNHVILYPFFLSRGQHVQVDIPTLVQAAAIRHPRVTYEITEPLGAQVDGLLQLIDNTVSQTL